MADSNGVRANGAATPKGSPTSTGANQTVRVVRKKASGSIWDDKVTRILAVILGVIIVGGLLTAVVALMNGTIDLSGTPQSAGDRAVLDAEGAMELAGEDVTADNWQQLVAALIDAGKPDEAKQQLAKAKKSGVDVTEGQNLLYMDAYFAQMDGDTDKAIELYNEVMTKTKDAYDSELAKGGQMNWALAHGLHANYSASALALSTIYAERKEWETALGYLDDYLAVNPLEAGVYIDRGKIEVELGDYDAAEKDFKKALKYMPDDKEATEELKKIEGK